MIKTGIGPEVCVRVCVWITEDSVVTSGSDWFVYRFKTSNDVYVWVNVPLCVAITLVVLDKPCG